MISTLKTPLAPPPLPSIPSTQSLSEDTSTKNMKDIVLTTKEMQIAPPSLPSLPDLYKDMSKKLDIKDNMQEVSIKTKEMQSPVPMIPTYPNSSIPTLSTDTKYSDNMNIDYRDLKKTSSMELITDTQKNLLKNATSINLTIAGKDVSILPKDIMDKIKTLSDKSTYSMPIPNEDGTNYKLLQSPPSSDILLMKNDVGKTRSIGMLNHSLKTTTKEVQEYKDNMSKMSIMSKSTKLPSNIESFEKVSENIYKSGSTFAKIKNGEFVYTGFKI